MEGIHRNPPKISLLLICIILLIIPLIIVDNKWIDKANLFSEPKENVTIIIVHNITK
jgi:hypothetical protein